MILLAILSETKQGEETIQKEKFKTTKIIVSVSQRTAVIAMAHSKAHWGITKTAEAIVDNFAWEKMREDVKKIRTPMCHMPGETRSKSEGGGPHAKGITRTRRNRLSRFDWASVREDQLVQVPAHHDGRFLMICHGGPP